MQTVKIVQAVILMLIVALAASCAAGKEYSARIFGPRKATLKDSQAVTVRFLQLEDDSIPQPATGWVKNEALPSKDSALLSGPAPVVPETKPVAPAGEPVTKTGVPGTIRTKKTRNQ
ncbi:MAG: hypothetical protein HYZ15_15705 [Sphingobacteriales bacterium]|nr:hypothetical protein [Sphingobacteriales bacterium]